MTGRLGAALIVLAAAAAASGQDDVSIEVRGADKVLGTIRPTFEREAMTCRLVQGTTLRAAVKSTQKTGPVPTLEVLIGGVAAGASVVPKGRGAAIVPFVVPATGTYVVRVAGDGARDGDYQLNVSWTAQKSFPGTGTAGAATSFPFSMPANAKVSIALTAAPGSQFVPHLLGLDDPDAVATPLSGAKFGPQTLAKSGDWTVRFQSDGPSDAYRISVKVAPPKTRPQTTDIRDSGLAGSFSGGAVVVGGVVGPQDGGTVLVGGTGTPIDGASVTVPPDAVGQATGIFIAQAGTFPLADGVHSAGPVVEFGPSGTHFAKPVTVTMPYDPAAFPGGTSSLVIYVKESDGTLQPITPDAIGANTVTFSVSGFSKFAVATSAARPMPNGGYRTFDVMGLPDRGLRGFVGVGDGFASIDAAGFSMFNDLQGISFDPGGVTGAPPSAPRISRLDSLQGNPTQVDDATTEIRNANGALLGRLRRGIRDDVLVFHHEPGLQLGTIVMFRGTNGAATPANVAGRWHAFVWEFKSDVVDQTSNTIPLFAVADAGSATISGTGEAVFQFAGGVKRFTDYPGGAWGRETAPHGTSRAQVLVVSDFGTVLRFESSTNDVKLTPVLDGEMLVGRMLDVDRGLGGAAAQVGLLLLVRESKRAKAAGVVGQYFDAAGGVDLVPPPGAGAPTERLGLHWRAESGAAIVVAGGAITRPYLVCLSGYDATESTPIQSTSQIAFPSGSRVSTTSRGDYAVSAAGVVGATTPAGDFVTFLERDDLTLGLGFAVRFTTDPTTKR